MDGARQRFDDLFATIATSSGSGIDGLLDAFFGFLARRTDFYTGKGWEFAKDTVLTAFERNATTINTNSIEKPSAAAPAGRGSNKVATDDIPDECRVVDVTEEEELPPPPDVVADKPPEGNGGRTSKYRWTQTLTQAEVWMRVPAGTRGRDCFVELTPTSLEVRVCGETYIKGELHQAVKTEESLWTVEDDGKSFHLILEKASGGGSSTPGWWSCIIKGDDEIDTQKIQPEPSKLSDLDPELRSTVEKMMFDQEMKRQGLPTSDQREQARLLEQFQRAHPELDFSQAKINYGV